MEDTAKTPPTTFRVPLDLLEELREIARIETRSLSGQVVFMLKRAVTEYQVAAHSSATELPRPMVETNRTVDQAELNRIIERRLAAAKPATAPNFKPKHKAAAKVLSTD